MATAAVTAVTGNDTISNLLVGAVGGVAGYFISNSIVYQATYVSTSGTNIIEDYKDLIQSTFGNVADNVAGLLTGDLTWYLGAAGIGIINKYTTEAIFGGDFFPLITAVAGGFGLSAVNNLIFNPPTPAQGVNAQSCADGDLKGCAVYKDGKSDGLAGAQESVKQNWQYFAMGPIGIGYVAWKTFGNS